MDVVLFAVKWLPLLWVVIGVYGFIRCAFSQEADRGESP